LRFFSGPSRLSEAGFLKKCRAKIWSKTALTHQTIYCELRSAVAIEKFDVPAVCSSSPHALVRAQGLSIEHKSWLTVNSGRDPRLGSVYSAKLRWACSNDDQFLIGHLICANASRGGFLPTNSVVAE
jgi:hypothetical protein